MASLLLPASAFLDGNSACPCTPIHLWCAAAACGGSIPSFSSKPDLIGAEWPSGRAACHPALPGCLPAGPCSLRTQAPAGADGSELAESRLGQHDSDAPYWPGPGSRGPQARLRRRVPLDPLSAFGWNIHSAAVLPPSPLTSLQLYCVRPLRSTWR